MSGCCVPLDCSSLDWVVDYFSALVVILHIFVFLFYDPIIVYADDVVQQRG